MLISKNVINHHKIFSNILCFPYFLKISPDLFSISQILSVSILNLLLHTTSMFLNFIFVFSFRISIWFFFKNAKSLFTLSVPYRFFQSYYFFKHITHIFEISVWFQYIKLLWSYFCSHYFLLVFPNGIMLHGSRLYFSVFWALYLRSSP